MSFSDEANGDKSLQLCGDSATWKDIQKSTFTRWANERLRKASSSSSSRIKDLQTDLSDGVLLIGLVEALSGSKLPVRHNVKATSRSQKLENVTVCLEYLEKQQGVRIINIDSSDIVDGKLKLILGLMWTLILHYSISSRSWQTESSDSDSESKSSAPASSPRQRLLAWINDRLPDDRRVTNFTRDWSNGKTLAALVNSFDSGLCSEWREWSETDCVQNTATAMKVATVSLNIAELMTAEEMCDQQIDEYSVMTYLSQFPSARLNEDLMSTRSSGLMSNLSQLSLQDDMAFKAGLVNAFGDGLSVGYVGHPARFSVTSNQLVSPPLQVSVDGPAKVKLTRQDVGSGYEFEYVTAVEGSYLVTILYEGELHVPGSPFKANFTPLINTYKVNVFTSDVFGAGTDANVHIVLVGEIGETVKVPLKSSKTHMNKFERGQTDEFIVDANNIGELRKIRIGHDGSGAGADWHLDSVIIELPLLHRNWKFNHNQWIGKDSGRLDAELLPADDV